MIMIVIKKEISMTVSEHMGIIPANNVKSRFEIFIISSLSST